MKTRILTLCLSLFCASSAFAAPPVNDNYASFSDLGSALPVNAPGTNVEGTVEVGEALVIPSTTSTVWFRWTVPASGTYVIKTRGASFDTTLAVFTATVGLPGVGDRLAFNDDVAFPELTSKVTFDATAGQILAIQVGGFSAADTGTFPLVISSASTPDNYADRFTLPSAAPTQRVFDNTLATTEPGEALANPSVEATVWAEWTAPFTGPYTVDTTSGPEIDTFLVVYLSPAALPVMAEEINRNNDAPGHPNGGSEVTFSATAGQRFAFQIGGMGAIARGPFTLRVQPVPPTNDNLANQIFLSGLPTNAVGYNLGATLQAGEHLPITNMQATVWYSWTASVADYVQVDTLSGSSFDTTLAAYAGLTGEAASLLAANDDAPTGGLRSRIIIPTTTGQTYLFQVGGLGTARGQFTLNFSLALPPNDNYAQRVNLGTTNVVATNGWNMRATIEGGESLASTNHQATVWYSWTAPLPGSVTVDTLGAGEFDTILAVYQDSGTLPQAAARVVVNDDAVGAAASGSAATFTAQAGQTYAFQVGGYGTNRGTFPLNLSLTPSAAVLAMADPQGGSLTNGASFSTATVAGTPRPLVFTIRNDGGTTLSNVSASVIGTDASDYSLTTLPPTSLAPLAQTNFTVTFNPSLPESIRNATLRLVSSDPGGSPYDVSLAGEGLTFTRDLDADGLNDAAEFQMAALGFNYLVAQPALVGALTNNASGAGLYTPAQVQALHVGTPLIQRTPGGFMLTLGVSKKTNLTTGSYVPLPMSAPQTLINTQGQLEFHFTTPDNAAFFRLEAH